MRPLCSSALKDSFREFKTKVQYSIYVHLITDNGGLSARRTQTALGFKGTVMKNHRFFSIMFTNCSWLLRDSHEASQSSQCALCRTQTALGFKEKVTNYNLCQTVILTTNIKNFATKRKKISAHFSQTTICSLHSKNLRFSAN